MQRDLGVVDLLQDVMPEALAFPVAMVTQLGAIWFASTLIALVYVYHDRRDAMIIAGLLLAGTGIWRTIKIVAPVPRPEQPFVDPTAFPTLLQALYELAVVDTGPGFPSGHAVTTTVLYFSLAAILTVGTKRRRYAAAFGFVALVGATRISLGVHYITDVIAGALIGQTLLLTAAYMMARTQTDNVTIALTAGLVFSTICLLANLAIAPISLWEIGLFVGAVSVFVWWHTNLPSRLGVRVGDPF